jgi:hypothetical protein
VVEKIFRSLIFKKNINEKKNMNSFRKINKIKLKTFDIRGARFRKYHGGSLFYKHIQFYLNNYYVLNITNR